MDSSPVVPPPEDMPGMPRERRYSLRQMLREVDLERVDTAIGQEKLEQGDITKLFQRNPRPKKRAARPE